MSERHLDRCQLLLTQLLFEREAAGGDLSEDEEWRYVALLDEIWGNSTRVSKSNWNERFAVARASRRRARPGGSRADGRVRARCREDPHSAYAMAHRVFWQQPSMKDQYRSVPPCRRDMAVRAPRS